MFITTYNLDLLINAVCYEESTNGVSFTPNFENIDCLSKIEKDKLKKMEFFFRSLNLNRPIKFNPIEREDSKKYLYKENYPAFHKSDKCPRLKAKWSNIYLPQEVKDKGDHIIAKFRKIVMDQLYKSQDALTDEGFINSLKIEFGIADINFGREIKDNSNAVDFSKKIEMLSLEDAKKQIEFLSKELDFFPKKSELHKKVFQMRYWDVAKIRWIEKNRSEEEKKVANELANLKANLIVAIMTAFQYENNFDMNNIEEEILLSLNFRKCSTCFKDEIPSFNDEFKGMINKNIY